MEGGVYPNRVKFDPVLVPDKPRNVKEFYAERFGQKDSSGYFRRSMREMPEEEFRLFRSFFEQTSKRVFIAPVSREQITDELKKVIISEALGDTSLPISIRYDSTGFCKKHASSE